MSIFLGKEYKGMKDKILKVFDLIQDKNQKYELKTLQKNAEILQEEIHQFSLKILFVGEFNAGKSALLNAFMKKEILEENQIPETAIAGELVFDTEEYIEAVADGISKRYELTEATNIETAAYDYLIWHLNCLELKELKPCTLVDMPGFNSGVRAHNKAILQYSGKGNAYVLVIDCEKGTIKQNITEFINEIKNYKDNIAIAITKTELKIEEEITEIEKNIKFHAEAMFGNHVPVITTSKFDEQVQEKVRQLVNNFDVEKIFIQTFSPRIFELGMRCIDSLEIYKKSISLDMSQYDEEIEKHERLKKELTDKLKKEKGKLERYFKNTVIPSIIADIQNVLYGHVDELTKSLKTGEKNFSMMVNNILRPVLLSSTQEYVEQSFENFLGEIDVSDLDGTLQEIANDTLKKYQQANSKLQEIAKNADKFSVVYKTVTTTLAIATSAIAPWLELIIVFLPDIIKLFGRGNKEESLKNKVNNEIIPQIVEQLRPEIQNSLSDIKEEMICQVEEEINALIDCEMESIKNAKKNRENRMEEKEQKIEEVQADILEIKQRMENL